MLLGHPGVVGHDFLDRDIVEVAGFAIARDERKRAARARGLAQPAAVPWCQGAERRVAAVQQPRAQHERIAGDHVHELRARAVGGLGDCDEELPVLGLALDEDRLALVDLEGRLDDSVGVARE